MFISWRNLCLENVYLTCERGKYTSVVPHPRRLAAAKFNLVHYCSAIDLKEIVQSK